MRFALLNDERIEATKGAKGLCPSCGSELVAKCGEIKVHYWSHKKKCDDYWWENETEWHRNWKNEFPREWQEVIHKDESGEKHIADVKTDEDWVVEFQHSAIASEERNSRDQFYKKLIWVVDGTRRKTDVKQFQKVLNDNAHMDRPSRNFASSPTMPPKPIVRPSSTLYTRLCGGKNDGYTTVSASRTPAPMLIVIP